jgi:hypothetical protein
VVVAEVVVVEHLRQDFFLVWYLLLLLQTVVMV